MSYAVRGGALGGSGSRSSGTWPSRRRSSSPSPGLCRAVSAASSRASASDQRTPPCRPTTAGSSLTARTAAKPTPKRPTAAVVAVPLGGGAERGQRLDAGRVQRGAGVGGDEDARRRQGQPQPARHPGPGGGVGGVLRQLDDEAVPVAAEGEVLLGVGVLTEPGRDWRPRRRAPRAAAAPSRTGPPPRPPAARTCSRFTSPCRLVGTKVPGRRAGYGRMPRGWADTWYVGGCGSAWGFSRGSPRP